METSEVAHIVFLRHHAVDERSRSQLSATWWDQMDDFAQELCEKDCRLWCRKVCNTKHVGFGRLCIASIIENVEVSRIWMVDC